jgi:hypothetical protein
MEEERGSLVPRRPSGGAFAALPLLLVSGLLKLGCPNLLSNALGGCTPQQFNPGNAPTWDGNLSDLGSFIVAELIWLVSVLGDFVINIFSDVFESIGCLITGSFNGAIGFLQQSWITAQNSLAFAGPFAPVLAIGIVGAAAIGLLWVLVWAVREFVLGTTKTAEDEEEEIA